MRNYSLIVSLFLSLGVCAQSNFSANAYQDFLNSNKNLSYEAISEMHPLKNEYFKGIANGSSIDDYTYLDSITIKYHLTDDETALIEQNHFMVSERLSYYDFGNAFSDIYEKDMPVFISTDAILHPWHMSYDAILMDIEKSILEDNVKSLCKWLYAKVPRLEAMYGHIRELAVNIEDVDLYTTIAYSLSTNTLMAPHVVSTETVQQVWDAIQNENYTEIPLFSETARDIDFSQFIVRGHYTDGLENYFKTMMWLGRMEFLLSKTKTITDEDVKRMTIDAFMLNQIMEMVKGDEIIALNETIIEYFVGESDNLTPKEFSEVIGTINIDSAQHLLNEANMSSLHETLQSNSEYHQSILGNILMTNPYSTEPEPLPISYKLMGQRFILDSYILSNLVYDKIIYDEEKIWRPMPDPLDAMFVLGNENALPLLEDELQTYMYSSNLASLRYLVDSYDDDFWSQSYYNGWLNAIRKLNSPSDLSDYPVFCKSAAWQQEKLNTQLASWSQLRHDNLLYAKPSYTGGIECMYPHSYVEPYPDFFEELSTVANNMANFFDSLSAQNESLGYFSYHFRYFGETTSTLKNIATKELQQKNLNNDEITFLQNMLFTGGGCKAKFTGWYSGLFYVQDDETKPDFIIADIHTQPTEVGGNMVGNVMHVGTGKVNMGVFLSKSPTNNVKMAFIGPVFSYYEKYTANFKRHTDEEWETLVFENDIPVRPDWVNIYLADNSGKKREQGRELPSKTYTQVGISNNASIAQIKAFPNPAFSSLNIALNKNHPATLNVYIYDNIGKHIKTISNKTVLNNAYLSLPINDLNSGLYYCVVKGNNFTASTKFIKQ